MIITKTYQTIVHLQFHTKVRLGIKKVVPIDFLGGGYMPHKVYGTFTTSNPEIQKALEKAKNFNVKYRLIKTVKTEPVKETPKESEKTGEEKLVPGITTVQKAKEWLLNEFDDVTQAKVQNKEKVLATAKEKSIKFPDLV